MLTNEIQKMDKFEGRNTMGQLPVQERICHFLEEIDYESALDYLEPIDQWEKHRLRWNISDAFTSIPAAICAGQRTSSTTYALNIDGFVICEQYCDVMTNNSDEKGDDNNRKENPNANIRI